jgi:hypothetical protein
MIYLLFSRLYVMSVVNVMNVTSVIPYRRISETERERRQRRGESPRLVSLAVAPHTAPHTSPADSLASLRDQVVPRSAREVPRTDPSRHRAATARATAEDSRPLDASPASNPQPARPEWSAQRLHATRGATEPRLELRRCHRIGMGKSRILVDRKGEASSRLPGRLWDHYLTERREGRYVPERPRGRRGLSLSARISPIALSSRVIQCKRSERRGVIG